MDIGALHVKFQEMKWEGVATFCSVIQELRCGGVSMAFINRTYQPSDKDFDSTNDLYTVENYLSDLLTRRHRFSEEEAQSLNGKFGQLAYIIRGSHYGH